MRFGAQRTTWPKELKNGKLQALSSVHAQSELRRAFRRSFSAFAQGVHRRRALGQALTGAAGGLALGALLALVLWAGRMAELRPFAAGLGALGAFAGVYWAARRRWSDSDVALYLDARLASHETLTTALGLGAGHADEPALAHVVERATQLLGRADPARTKPPLWTRVHAVLPISAAAIVAICWLPLPPAPKPPAAAPGAERVRIENLKGLERIEALARLHGQSPEQDERLKKLADRARKLRESLANGVEKRQALSDVEKLRDATAAERLKLGDQQNRPGLDAALGAFGSNLALRDAQKALGNGDLTAFDEEMQKLANRTESSDRKAAKEALGESAKQAREKGSKALADALDAERRSFERRQAQSEALRELAGSMKGKLSAEAEQDLKEFGGSGSPKAEARLEESLERALEGMSPAERKRLAERLEQQLQAEDGAASPMSKKQLEEFAQELSSHDGVESLKKQLEELAKPEANDDAERERGLEDAERGGAQAERGMGASPMPMPYEGSKSSNLPDAGGAEQGAGNGSVGAGGAGIWHGSGAGDHQGSTPEIAGKELRSKADAQLSAGASMHGATLGRAPARAGETANRLGTGTLGEARQTEVGAVDHADIPEAYREQVGRYFEP